MLATNKEIKCCRKLIELKDNKITSFHISIKKKFVILSSAERPLVGDGLEMIG